MEPLILVATLGGPTMFARIGMMQALNRVHIREFNPKQKEPHWALRSGHRVVLATDAVRPIEEVVAVAKRLFGVLIMWSPKRIGQG